MCTRKLILVVGLPGTGKTTFARALSTSIGAQHLNSDIVRHDFGKRGHYDAASKAAIYNEMLNRTEDFFKNQQQVVIDATFYKSIFRKPYQLLGEKYNVELVWIEIKADESLIEQRVSKKREYSEADFEVYNKIKKDYEPLEMTHLVLWSSQMSVDEMVVKAKESLLL